jgi:hypothetical protein
MIGRCITMPRLSLLIFKFDKTPLSVEVSVTVTKKLLSLYILLRAVVVFGLVQRKPKNEGKVLHCPACALTAFACYALAAL